MKIEHAMGQAQQHAAIAPQRPTPPAPKTMDATVGSTESAETPSVVVEVNTDPSTGPGKSANSPAHRARAMMAAYSELGATFEGLRFGRLVSSLARGEDPSALFAMPSTEPGEDEGDESGAIGEGGVGDGTTTEGDAAASSGDGGVTDSETGEEGDATFGTGDDGTGATESESTEDGGDAVADTGEATGTGTGGGTTADPDLTVAAALLEAAAEGTSTEGSGLESTLLEELLADDEEIV